MNKIAAFGFMTVLGACGGADNADPQEVSPFTTMNENLRPLAAEIGLVTQPGPAPSDQKICTLANTAHAIILVTLRNQAWEVNGGKLRVVGSAEATAECSQKIQRGKSVIDCTLRDDTSSTTIGVEFADGAVHAVHSSFGSLAQPRETQVVNNGTQQDSLFGAFIGVQGQTSPPTTDREALECTEINPRDIAAQGEILSNFFKKNL